MRRLQNLADGIAVGKQYYISEQDYEAETDGEIYSLIDEYILNTEWNYTFQDIGVIPEDYFFKNMDTNNNLLNKRKSGNNGRIKFNE